MKQRGMRSLWEAALPLAAARLYKAPQWHIRSHQLRIFGEPHTHRDAPALLRRFLGCSAALFVISRLQNHRGFIGNMKERRNTQPLVVRCKLVLVGDVQCGKTAMLQVLAKDCYPEVCSSCWGRNSCFGVKVNPCIERCCVFFKLL